MSINNWTMKCSCGGTMKHVNDEKWDALGTISFDCQSCSGKISVSKDNEFIIK